MANTKLRNQYIESINSHLQGKMGKDNPELKGTVLPFDRENKVEMEKFFVSIKNSSGEYEQQTLDQYMLSIEGLSEEEYASTMDNLFQTGKVFYYPNDCISPSILIKKTVIDHGVKQPDIVILSIEPAQPDTPEHNNFDKTVNQYKEYYKNENDPATQESRNATLDYLSKRISEREAEIKNPQLIEEKAIARLKRIDAQAAERLGNSKKINDGMFSIIQPASSDDHFDRFDLKTRDKYFVMVQANDGEFVKQSLANYIADIEQLPREEYEREVSNTLQQRNVFVNEPTNLMPTTWGMVKGTAKIEKVLRISSSILKGKRATLALNEAAPEGVTAVFKEKNLYTTKAAFDDEVSVASDEEIEQKIKQTNFAKATDLPEREEMPFYLRNRILRKIVFAFSNGIKEAFRRMSVVEEAYKKREALGKILKNDIANIVTKAKIEAKEIAEIQNKNLKVQQEELQNNSNVVENHSKTIKMQSRSDESAGWRIEDVFGAKPNVSGLKNYNLDINKIPSNIAIDKDLSVLNNFSEKNQAYFSFAKMLTSIYTAKEGTQLNNAIKSIIPEKAELNSVPTTFVAKQMLYETFSGKSNSDMNKLLEPLVIDARLGANKSIEQFKNGDAKAMSSDIQAGATVLMRVLNSTSPEEFVSQDSKWPIAAKCIKEILDITEKFPDMMKDNPIPTEMMNEMKGWAKVSNAIIQSSKARTQLVSNDNISYATRAKLWKDVALESKMRGLCAYTYKSNKVINNPLQTKNIDTENSFIKATVDEKFAIKNKEAKGICLLGQDDKMIQAMKDEIKIDSGKLTANKIKSASLLVATVKHNNMLNAEMMGDLVNRENTDYKAQTKTEEVRQLKSNKDMLLQ